MKLRKRENENNFLNALRLMLVYLQSGAKGYQLWTRNVTKSQGAKIVNEKTTGYYFSLKIENYFIIYFSKNYYYEFSVK